MKKAIWTVAILAIVLLVAPFAIGSLAEQRIDKALDKLVLQAPYLSIAERKYSKGWFSSQQDVTFEVFRSFTGGLGGEKSPRFTVHNVIHHGPILGAALGIARVDTHFVLSDKVRQAILGEFGTAEPYELSTYIGFLGGGTTRLTSDSRKLKTKDGADVAWEKLKIVLDYSHDGDSISMDGQWPSIESRDDKKGSHFLMKGLRLNLSGKRIVGDLYDTHGEFALDEMRNVEANNPEFEWNGARYEFATEPHGDFVDMVAKLGSGAMKTQKFSLKEAHYDFAMRRLHAATLDKLMTDVKESYQKQLGNPVSMSETMAAPYKKYGMELLKYDPEFDIDRINFVMDEGDGTIKGVIKLKGVTPQDVDAGSMALIPKIVADISVDLSEGLVTKLAGGTGPTDNAVAQGFVVRKDGRLTTQIAFHDAKLTINGKEQPIPGLGGPPQPAAQQE